MDSRKYFALSFAFGIIFAFLYNFQVVNHAPGGWFFPMVYICTLCTLVLYGLGLFAFTRGLIPLFFMLAAVASYFVYIFNYVISGDSAGIIAETSFFEAKEFVDYRLTVWIVLSFCISILFLRLTKKRIPHKNNALVLFLIAFVVVTVCQVSRLDAVKDRFQKECSSIEGRHITPFSCFDALAEYIKAQYRIKQRGPLKNSGDIKASLMEGSPEVIVLIVGESARADHFSCDGYKRKTSPHIDAEPGLTFFTNTSSFAATTRQSVPIMITDATSDNKVVSSSSILDVFNAQGYSTHWLSLNDRYNKNNNPTTRIIENVKDKRFRSFFGVKYKTSKDHMLLPAINETVKDSNTPCFIAVHTRGSHWKYQYRYTKEFERWKPAVADVTDAQRTINAYDNSILMTDDFIYRVINLIREKNAILVYCSDHGESLGEDGVFNHGNAKRPEQRHVPFLVWLSPKYRKLHPQTAKMLTLHSDMPISQDYIFYSLISLGCVKRQGHRYDLDLTSPKMIAGHGSFGVSKAVAQTMKQ